MDREEFEVQVALGTVRPSKNNGVTRIPPSAIERRIPVNGRVHIMLHGAVTKFNGVLPRTEIKGTKYSSSHIAFVEATGLMTRESAGGNKLQYRITDVGRKAYEILTVSKEKTAMIPIEINFERYLYHMNKNW